MGLNLSIKRMIFETTEKWNGKETITIKVPDIKQMAGRAGRFKVPGCKDAPLKFDAAGNTLPPVGPVGYVTTLDESDLKVVRTALVTDAKPIRTAGILPLAYHVELFASQFPSTKPFSEILREMADYMRTSNIFHMCSMDEQIETAKLFDEIPGLTVADRMTFVIAPIGRDPKTRLAVQKMAECVADGLDGSVLNIGAVDLEALDIKTKSVEHLQRLEALHKSLIVYLWLS